MLRNRRQPDPAPERVPTYDLGKIHAERIQQQAAAQAAAMASIPAPVHQLVAQARTPTPSPLENMLDALVVGRPLVKARLPHRDLAKEHDVELAELLDHADRLHSAAVAAAFAYQQGMPGTAQFVAEVDAARSEAEVVEILGSRQHRRWAAAWGAQRRALAADEECRRYALAATDVRRRLEERLEELLAEIVELLARTASTGRSHHHDRARDEVSPTWRQLERLAGWMADPARPYLDPAPWGWPPGIDEEVRAALTAMGEQVEGRSGSYTIGNDGTVDVTEGAPMVPRRGRMAP